MMNVVKAPKELEEKVNAVTREQILANTYKSLVKQDSPRYENCIKERFMDMDLILRFQLGEEEWIPLTDQFLLSKGVTPGEAWEAAKMPDAEVANFMDMVVIGAFAVFGAVCITDYGKRREAAELAGGNFYALPSSIHEFVVIPESDEVSVKFLKKMVVDTNKDLVVLKESEVLSDSVYFYNADTDRLSIIA